MTKADHLYRRSGLPGAPCSLCGRKVQCHPSQLEHDFDALDARHGWGFRKELEFARKRQPPIPRAWRLDRYILEARIAVELDGGAWTGGAGRHSQTDRHNLLALDDWLVLRFGAAELRLGIAEHLVQAALAIRQAPPAERPRLRAALRPEFFPTAAVRKAALQELKARRR